MAHRHIPQRAPIIANGGFIVLDDLLPEATHQRLRLEGIERATGAEEQRCEEHDMSGFRGGNPARWLRSATGGPVQHEIYQATVMAENISYFCGRPVKPTGGEGTFSYYDLPGHFLGLHRDINTCDVTLITCLHRKHSKGKSGALRIFYRSLASKLTDVVKDREVALLDVHLEERQSILLLGGCLPHEVLPAAKGYERYISVLCYKMETSNNPSFLAL